MKGAKGHSFNKLTKGKAAATPKDMKKAMDKKKND